MQGRWNLTTKAVAAVMLIAVTNFVWGGQDSEVKPPTTHGPSGKMEYSSGYLASPIDIPHDPRITGITHVQLECPELNDQGGTGSISFSNSKVGFNDFGDAEVLNKRETLKFDVNLKPIPLTDFANESRRVFLLEFPEQRWQKRMIYVWSSGVVTESRLLIVSQKGQLPEIKPSDYRKKYDIGFHLAHILPETRRIPHPERPASEKLRGDFGLQTYHFQSIHPGPKILKGQSKIRLGGSIDGDVFLLDDGNRTSFDPFGDEGLSTMVGFPSRRFKLVEQADADPTGESRRLFHLQFMPPDPKSRIRQIPKPPDVDYSLVLAPKIDGEHRLIIRRQGRIRHVLPLYDRRWREYLRKQAQISGMEPDVQQAIAELRRLAGNRIQFYINDGKLSSVNLYSFDAPVEVFSQLRRLSDLKGLSIRGDTKLTAEALTPISNLATLTSLSIYDVHLSDQLLSEVSKLEGLSSLRIEYANRRVDPGEDKPTISEAGFASIARLKKLNRLMLDGPKVSDNGLVHLHGLKELNVYNEGFSLQAINELLESLPDAEVMLYMKRVEQDRKALLLRVIGDKDRVIIGGKNDDETLKQLEGLKGVKVFELSSLHKVTNAGLASIAKHKNLEGLSFQHAKQLTDDGLRHLSQMRRLKSLNLWACDLITDDGLEDLRELKNLKSLSLGGTKVTLQGIQRLQLALPECEIEK